MTKYICQNCKHVAGYHIKINNGYNIMYDRCEIIKCKCEKFEWDEEQRQQINKDIEGKNESNR